LILIKVIGINNIYLNFHIVSNYVYLCHDLSSIGMDNA